MKLNVLICFNLFFIIFCAQAQNTQILKVEYDEYVIYIPSIVNKYKGVLYSSTDLSFYKTIYQISDDENSNKKKIEEAVEDVFVVKVTDEHKYFSEVVINHKIKELIEHLFEHRSLKNFYSVYEKQPEIKWELLQDEKKINDYICKKATTTFRGRAYEVWYTPDIPISVGPWKFNGLPGLILSVKDTTDGYYSWEATSVTYPYKGNEINFSEILKDKANFTKISYQDFDIKFFEKQREKFKIARAKTGERGFKVKYSYSTFQHKEPINEWRTQTEFEF